MLGCRCWCLTATVRRGISIGEQKTKDKYKVNINFTLQVLQTRQDNHQRLLVHGKEEERVEKWQPCRAGYTLTLIWIVLFLSLPLQLSVTPARIHGTTALTLAFSSTNSPGSVSRLPGPRSNSGWRNATLETRSRNGSGQTLMTRDFSSARARIRRLRPTSARPGLISRGEMKCDPSLWWKWLSKHSILCLNHVVLLCFVQINWNQLLLLCNFSCGQH